MEPCLPSNQSMAEHRLKLFRRRLVKDLDLRQNYSKFIEHLQARNVTEKISTEEINRKSGVVWYLLRHSVNSTVLQSTIGHH